MNGFHPHSLLLPDFWALVTPVAIVIGTTTAESEEHSFIYLLNEL